MFTIKESDRFEFIYKWVFTPIAVSIPIGVIVTIILEVGLFAFIIGSVQLWFLMQILAPAIGLLPFQGF